MLDKLLTYYSVFTEIRSTETQNHFRFLAKEEKSRDLFKGCCYQNPQNFSWWRTHWKRKEFLQEKYKPG